MTDLEPYRRTFQVDGSGDLVIDSMNSIPIITGEEKVQQDLSILLRTFLTDDPFALDFGFDFKAVADSNDDPSVLSGELQTAIFKYQFTKFVSIDNIVDTHQGDGTIQRVVYVTVTLYTAEEISLQVVI